MSKRTIVLPHPEYDIDVLKRLIAEAEATPPPAFQVGQWVKHKDATNWPAEKVIAIAPDDRFTLKLSPACYGDPKFYRLATPEEIAAATRIVPKVGMIIENTDTGNVYRCYQLGDPHSQWHGLTRAFCGPLLNVGLSSDLYRVLPRYTIEGAEP